jgi:hypothetical protein
VRLLDLLLGLILPLRLAFERDLLVRGEGAELSRRVALQVLLLLLSQRTEEHDLRAWLQSLLALVDQLELLGTSLEWRLLGFVLSQRFGVLLHGKFMEILGVDTTVPKTTHLLQKFIILLVPLMEEGVNVGKRFTVPALVVFATGVLDLLAVVQLQPREDLLRMRVIHERIFLGGHQKGTTANALYLCRNLEILHLETRPLFDR